ncbi:MAG: hypothetical protein K0S32_4225 [Bacteroidetes bacterium]|jgi:hypothetical protein|nr:hypothetical protein [Bacteroidota bacterium]
MKKSLFTLGLIATGLFASAQTRMSLFEEFTGENCPPCASTNPGLNAILLNATNATKVIALKWQVPIPSAPSATWSLYKTNQAEIDWRYKSSGYNYPSQNTSTNAVTNGINSAPSGRLDGQHQWAFGATSDHPFYISNAVIASAQSQTTNFSIQMSETYDANFNNAVVTVTVTSSTAFTSAGTLMFRLCLVEREIAFPTAPGTNGETFFEDVVRKSYPTSITGTAVTSMGTPMPGTWTMGQSQTYTINCAIPSYVHDKGEMAFVGFVQDDGNKKVMQAFRTPKASIPNDAKFVSLTGLTSFTCATNTDPAVLTFKNQGANAITAATITPYIDGVAQTQVMWSGNLAGGTSTALTLGTYTAVTGQHTFSVSISSVSGGDINTANNNGSMAFGLVTSYWGGQVIQPFTTTTFPPNDWMMINPNGGTATWSRSSTVGNGGAGSAKYDFYNNSNVGDNDDLFITPMDLTTSATPMLTFDYAYAQYSSENDKLDVLVSTDCGQNWTNVWTKQGSGLATAPATTGNFVPSAAQWTNAAVSLASVANQAQVLVKFKATSDYGNNLYVDNVNLSGPTSLTKYNQNLVSFDVYPNPASTSATIKTYSAFEQTGVIVVYNTLGQVVKTINVSLAFGINEVALNTSDLATGVYNVVLNTDKGSVTKKLTVTK